jgi:hypothetical protein
MSSGKIERVGSILQETGAVVLRLESVSRKPARDRCNKSVVQQN